MSPCSTSAHGCLYPGRIITISTLLNLRSLYQGRAGKASAVWGGGDLEKWLGRTYRLEEDKAQLGGSNHSGSPALDSKFTHNRVDVELNRVLADFQATSNRLVG